jgi:hypothetical protein
MICSNDFGSYASSTVGIGPLLIAVPKTTYVVRVSFLYLILAYFFIEFQAKIKKASLISEAFTF